MEADMSEDHFVISLFKFQFIIPIGIRGGTKNSSLYFDIYISDGFNQGIGHFPIYDKKLGITGK